MPRELRVHGVSGTPPAEMLYTDPVTYDQGRDLATVYERNRDPWDVRAFHWGSLTSRSSLTALWILLAPFAMANVAGWMSESPNIWSRIWVRVAGLSLTGVFFAQVANMALDIPSGSWLSSGVTVSLFALASVVVVLGLGLISTQSSFRPLGLGERLSYLFVPTVTAMNPRFAAEDWGDPAHRARLTGSRMWTIHSVVHRHRRIHISFGMAVLALVAARTSVAETAELAAVTIAGLSLVAMALSSGATASRRPVLVATAWLPLLAAVVLVGAMWSLSVSPLPEVVDVSDDVTFEIALILGAGAGAGLIGELLMTRFSRGWVPLGLLAIAALAGGTLGLTGSMVVESILTEGGTPRTFDGGAGFVTVAMLGLVLVVTIVFVVAMIVPRSQEREESLVRRGILRARWLLGSAGVYGIAMALFAVWKSCNGPRPGCGQDNLTLWEWMTEDEESLFVLFGLPFDPTSLLGWAKVLMVAVPAVLIIRSIVGGLLNGQDSRRQVSILWDLGSFWPRWYHPLAPPAYGPYAITRLQTIIADLEPDVLTAHSQGSLIAAVALGLMPEDPKPGLLVTYGSQIGGLYPTLFPAVGLDELVAEVDRQMDLRWLNLWRPSDPVGGQVISALGDRNWKVDTGLGHSRYELTPEFCAARLVEGRPGARPEPDMIADCWDRG